MVDTKATGRPVYGALLAAQKEMGPLLKNASNPHLNKKYADLSSLIETIAGPLGNNGLVFTQRIAMLADGSPSLITELVHAASGDAIVSEAPIISKDPTNPQVFGAALTYMRRYSLMSIAGLAPEDDDGHAATKAPRPQQQPAERIDAPQQAPERPTEALTDKQFSDKLLTAMTDRDGQAFRELSAAAGKNTKRWKALIQVAESEPVLDWVLRQMERFSVTDQNLLNEADARRGLLKEGALAPA
jgi:hypothetical protein